MTTAITLATWVVIIGSYFVLATGLAILLGMYIHRNEERAEWQREDLIRYQQQLETPMRTGLWMEDEPTWQFPARPRIYDQANGTPETR